MSYDFDKEDSQEWFDSYKWLRHREQPGDDVLSLDVAEMDFRSPQPIQNTIREYAERGRFGYEAIHYDQDRLHLKQTICERLEARYNWKVSPGHVIILPGVASGLNIACRAFSDANNAVLTCTPVYPSFLKAPINQGCGLNTCELILETDYASPSRYLYYAIDFNQLKESITKHTRLFLLCNPHNPVGKLFSSQELSQIAQICIDHDLIICSDDIHGDLVLGNGQYVPIASLSPEIAERTITFIAPSKTFNLSGLSCGIAIISNAELRQQFMQAKAGIVPYINSLGYYAANAAYTQCQEWLDRLLIYLTANRDFAVDYIYRHMPRIQTTMPNATYLLWLDCRNIADVNKPGIFFQKRAKVALNEGQDFGQGGEGFVRLNFACQRSTLVQALERMQRALEEVSVA